MSSKRKSSQHLPLSSSPRKSRRVAGLPPGSDEPSAPQAPSPSAPLAPLAPSEPEQERVRAVFSALSTQPEIPENWPELQIEAASRLEQYVPQQKDDERLKACLLAFLQWLPEGGRESLARDILQCNTDEDLYKVFLNLRTGLLYTSKYFVKYLIIFGAG